MGENTNTSKIMHASHPDLIKRLKRASGHLSSVINMIEQQKPCLDIAQQLYAVEKAIHNAKKVLIHDHIDHCLDQVVSESAAEAMKQLDEFKEITKYL